MRMRCLYAMPVVHSRAIINTALGLPEGWQGLFWRIWYRQQEDTYVSGQAALRRSVIATQTVEMSQVHRTLPSLIYSCVY